MPTLFEDITSFNNLERAYKKSQKGKEKYKRESLEFSRDETFNLLQIRESLLNDSYKFGGYIHFTVHEPKERVIDAPHLQDKIVQLAINEKIKQIYNPCFIYDSYACIDGKGTHKCVKRISKFIKQAKWRYGESAYIVKLDIKKFFYTIDRSILKEILAKKISCKDSLNLIYKIINSADEISEKGLPLGNTLSQICANIYMNELDQYCKRKLGIKYYVRYADDVILVLENKDEALEKLGIIKKFLSEKLNLETNVKKTKIFPISQGINTVGFKIYATHRLLRNDSKKKIKRKARKMPRLLLNGAMTKEKAEQILNSWMGHAKIGSSKNFIKKLLKRNPYIYLKKDILKVNIKIILRSEMYGVQAR